MWSSSPVHASTLTNSLVVVGQYGHGGREGRSAFLDERTLMDIYGRPWFKAVNESGLRGVMASHNQVNYEPMHGSHLWLTETLRERFGFGEGYIAADADDVQQLHVTQQVASSDSEAACLAVQAGLDQDLNSLHNTPFGSLTNISAAKSSGELDAAIDRAAANVLRLKFAAGLFDGQMYANESHFSWRNSAEHRQLARNVAADGIIL